MFKFFNEGRFVDTYEELLKLLNSKVKLSNSDLLSFFTK